MKINPLVFLLLFMFLLPGGIKAQADISIEAQWQQIIEECQEILLNQPADIETRFKLAVGYANLGNISHTMDELEALRKQNGEKKPLDFIAKYQDHYTKEPENVFILNYLAFAYYIADHYTDSKIFFKKIIEVNPEQTMAYNFLALVHGSLNEYDAALARVEQAQKIEENQFSHLVFGLIYYQQGNLFKAMWHLAKSGKLGIELINR